MNFEFIADRSLLSYNLRGLGNQKYRAVYKNSAFWCSPYIKTILSWWSKRSLPFLCRRHSLVLLCTPDHRSVCRMNLRMCKHNFFHCNLFSMLIKQDMFFQYQQSKISLFNTLKLCLLLNIWVLQRWSLVFNDTSLENSTENAAFTWILFQK